MESLIENDHMCVYVYVHCINKRCYVHCSRCIHIFVFKRELACLFVSSLFVVVVVCECVVVCMRSSPMANLLHTIQPILQKQHPRRRNITLDLLPPSSLLFSLSLSRSLVTKISCERGQSVVYTYTHRSMILAPANKHICINK